MPNENNENVNGSIVIYVERSAELVQMAYTVPIGKRFVLTAWTLTNEVGQPVTARLRRNKVRVAFSKIWDPPRGHNHLVFPSGIVFGPEEPVELEGSVNLGQHYFYGYLLDA